MLSQDYGNDLKRLLELLFVNDCWKKMKTNVRQIASEFSSATGIHLSRCVLRDTLHKTRQYAKCCIFANSGSKRTGYNGAEFIVTVVIWNWGELFSLVIFLFLLREWFISCDNTKWAKHTQKILKIYAKVIITNMLESRYWQSCFWMHIFSNAIMKCWNIQERDFWYVELLKSAIAPSFCINDGLSGERRYLSGWRKQIKLNLKQEL